ncbi:xanthine dehydrogenase family protein molybdopterin-binding subunit [Sporomusa sphaeroides]|uniref:Xanthine dehydrogenase molybdenum-binding subunit n=1 Tax=Sporomusa sphaeroides DSM 2875 TaxID=1337886 RepID=A0ABP2CFT2_9FIRM|nr:molybdopterin cofactor-binding domain-containing protein [Sporomusa sphaeroides]OLS55342.1 xanthine dehydrogenase molybdenum-binding subunit [Sporomusa sphaeroides DSM 2875]CVK21280.1 Xanthine dehydrogenase molybdenum-binding subunit [Sporomusa sphaeroides DSM 2875]
MKYVGKGLAKTDAIAISTGKPVYTEDLAPANALVVKILRSPHAFARITAIDTSKAKLVAGVECILTYKDVPQVRFTLAGQSYPEPSPYDRLILDPLVRYVGDEVAIIAAVDEKAANAAMKLIKVSYEIFEPVLDFEQAIDHTSVVHPESDLFCNFPIGMDKERNICSSHTVAVGDVDEELKKCDIVIEETYYTQAQAHAMMETFRSFTYLDHAGRLVIVSSTQVPFHIRRHVARALELPASKVRVIKPRIGGGFGGKQTGSGDVFAALVSLTTGKPAMYIYSRTETFSATSSRHAMKLTVRLGADKDGFIRALDIENLSDTGAYGEHSSTTFSVCGEKTLPLYNKTRAVRYHGHAVYTNKMPAGALRGYGATQGTFALESAVNQLAARLSLDPAELRLKNLIKEGETCLIYQGKVLNSSALDRCIAKGKELIGWNEKYPRRELPDGKVRSVGMAVTMQGSGIAGIDTASIEIRLSDAGEYTLLTGSTDMGTGSDTVLAQIAAEVLQTSPDNIVVHAADTDVSPYDPGSYASSTAYVTGMAALQAAEDLKQQIIEQAAKLLTVTPAEIDFDGQVLRTTDGSQSMTLAKLAELQVLGAGKRQLVGNATCGSPISPPPFIAGFVEVEVDPATGVVELLDYVAVVDCGTVLNANLARIQVEGGIAQGIGMALYEDVRYSRRGKLQTNNFMQYKIPCRKDVGKITVAFEASYEPTGPFGAKSIGEVVINTPPPAIAHAVYNAVGAKVTRLPITPERVFMGMKSQTK